MVYVVQKLGRNNGEKRTLHRNMLLPCEMLEDAERESNGQQTSGEKAQQQRPCRVTLPKQHAVDNATSDENSDDEDGIAIDRFPGQQVATENQQLPTEVILDEGGHHEEGRIETNDEVEENLVEGENTFSESEEANLGMSGDTVNEDDAAEGEELVDDEDIDVEDEREIEEPEVENEAEYDEEEPPNRRSSRQRAPPTSFMYYKPGGDPMQITYNEEEIPATLMSLKDNIESQRPIPAPRKPKKKPIPKPRPPTANQACLESSDIERMSLLKWVKLQLDEWRRLGEWME